MATTSVTTDYQICAEALALLRQETTAEALASGDALTGKCTAQYPTSYRAVKDAWEWRNPLDGKTPADDWTRSALVYALARDLAIPVTGRAEDYKLYAAAYMEAIATAKNRDRDAVLAATTDPVEASVLSLFTMQTPDAAQLPYSMSTILARVRAFREQAAQEVLRAHPWTFATCVVPIPDAGAVPVPADCLRIIAVRDCDARIAPFRTIDGMVAIARDAPAPAATLSYIRDLSAPADAALWPGDALRVLAARIAADILPSMESIYMQRFADATKRDALQSNPSRTVRHRNSIASAIAGGVRPAFQTGRRPQW